MRTIWILPGWFGFIFGPAPSGSQTPISVANSLSKAAAWLVMPVVWYRRWHQRLDLAALEDHQLRDIGLDRRDVHREASKPFWHR